MKETKGHILLVDDHMEMIDYVRLHLENSGYAVTTATSGRAAVEAAVEGIDVIFLDVHMPGMSGIDACRALRNGRHADTPIIFLTADDSEASEVAGLYAGGNEYLGKPVSAVALERRVASYMRKAERSRKLQRAMDNWRREALTDALTGTRSRRYAEGMMQDGASGCVIMCDIDHFKSYNDTFGHEAGDECLKAVAKILMSFGHEVVRMGGEEFLVLVEAPEAGLAFAERIVKKIGSDVSKPDGQAVTISVGVVLVDADTEFASAIRHADMLLYRSKHGGRNTATFGRISDGMPDIPSDEGRRSFRDPDEDDRRREPRD